MSRIGNRPVEVPAGVDVTIGANNQVSVKGPRGELTLAASPNMTLSRENGSLLVQRPDNDRINRSLHGLTRTLINNMVVGVTTGYTRTLEITGVGYRATMDGTTLVLSVGYSHTVRMTPPEGISYTVEGQNRINVQGIDKQAVGEEAARIRRVRPPEPYKGKGIRFAGEVVRRKAGKAGKAK